jgi:hypothetical protein
MADPTIDQALNSASQELNDTSRRLANIKNLPTILDKSFLNSLSSIHTIEFTKCDSPEDATLYPGKLNTDKKGENLLTVVSTTEEHLNSIKYQASKMNSTHPVDIVLEYPDPSVGYEELNPNSNPHFLPNPNPVLGKIMSKVENEEYDGVLQRPSQEIDYRALMPDLNAMSMIGDPRWSLGCAMQAVLQEFTPRVDAYKEMLENLGTQVVDDCICNDDGVKIAKASANLIKVATDAASNNQPITLPTTADISFYFETQKENAFRNHADAFINYINKCFPLDSWPIREAFFVSVGFFFIKISKYANTVLMTSTGPVNPDGSAVTASPSLTAEDTSNKFFRYYPDQKDYISQQLGIPLINLEVFTVAMANHRAAADLLKNIPDYTKMSC